MHARANGRIEREHLLLGADGERDDTIAEDHGALRDDDLGLIGPFVDDDLGDISRGTKYTHCERAIGRYPHVVCPDDVLIARLQLLRALLLGDALGLIDEKEAYNTILTRGDGARGVVTGQVDVEDLVSMLGELAERSAPAEIPHENRVVVRRRQHRQAIRRHGTGLDLLGVLVEIVRAVEEVLTVWHSVCVCVRKEWGGQEKGATV